MSARQVDTSHYEFASYMSKRRWSSVWHQLDEVLAVSPGRVLEIGPGAGIFKQIAGCYGVTVETLDLDPDLMPDHVGSADDLPFGDASYDVVCAFQMLEHLPYEVSLRAFTQICRVAAVKIVISLPDALTAWPFSFHIPKVGSVQFLLSRPMTRRKVHEFDGQHYWELNKKDYELSRVVSDLSRAGNATLEKTYRVYENPYHRFLVFAPDNTSSE